MQSDLRGLEFGLKEAKNREQEPQESNCIRKRFWFLLTPGTLRECRVCLDIFGSVLEPIG